MLPVHKDTYMTVAQMLDKNRASIEAALPKHLTADRMMRLALGELRTTPKLLECKPASLVSAIVKACTLGLEIGSALGQAYLVPHKTECTLIIGYRGLITLAKRAGVIDSIAARVVHAKDHLEVEYGIEERLRHIPCTHEDPGPPVCAYAIARLAGGGTQFEVMSVREIEAIRKRSRTAPGGPWDTDWGEMAKKTVVRRLIKYLPITLEAGELAEALSMDETADPDAGAAGTQCPDPVQTLNGVLAAPNGNAETHDTPEAEKEAA